MKCCRTCRFRVDSVCVHKKMPKHMIIGLDDVWGALCQRHEFKPKPRPKPFRRWEFSDGLLYYLGETVAWEDLVQALNRARVVLPKVRAK